LLLFLSLHLALLVLFLLLNVQDTQQHAILLLVMAVFAMMVMIIYAKIMVHSNLGQAGKETLGLGKTPMGAEDQYQAGLLALMLFRGITLKILMMQFPAAGGFAMLMAI
jgi:hypothetical protein